MNVILEVTVLLTLVLALSFLIERLLENFEKPFMIFLIVDWTGINSGR